MIERLQQIDEQILLWIQDTIRNDGLTPIMQFVSKLLDHGMLSIAICIGLLAYKKTRKIGAVTTSSLILSTLITNVLLKPLIQRPRPYDTIETLALLSKKLTDFSFPSGHTSAATAVCGVLYFICPKKYGIPAVIFAVLVGLSRLYLGAHYPTDVFVGFAIGFLSSYIASKILVRKNNN